eukprot:scaffold91165_cov60-Phaeocystis_antarctica.AAC.1
MTLCLNACSPTERTELSSSAQVPVKVFFSQPSLTVGLHEAGAAHNDELQTVQPGGATASLLATAFTEPASAPSSTSTSVRVMFCSTPDASCAASPLGAPMLMLTDRCPSPSLSVTKTMMSEALTPSALARAAGRLLATEES